MVGIKKRKLFLLSTKTNSFINMSFGSGFAYALLKKNVPLITATHPNNKFPMDIVKTFPIVMVQNIVFRIIQNKNTILIKM